MALLKCKMCGGDIIAAEGQTYGVCDSCGSTVTLPRVDDQRMENLFNRANHFRMVSEFDKAVATYEMILNEDNANAEAHWGLLISRYGIEYVEDPTTHERIPTCHRIQMDSVLSDGDYLAALQYAPDAHTRNLYEAEGKRLSELQRGLLQVSAQTEPFDIFICYKETTEGGSRTKDSALAQDIYFQLTNAGYKVFFSRVTLESMLGQQYEPHIFAALNSAKVMLAIGTKPEYFNAVWVKNEWSRFLALSKKDRSKVLIPCYMDLNVYDLPDELSMLQSQDMGKLGFMQDLMRGIEKIVRGQKKEEKKEQASGSSAAMPGVESLLKRAILFLEDGDFKSADEYAEKVLDIDPEYAPAYIIKVCVATQCKTEAELAECEYPFNENADYQKALRFALPQFRTVYESYNQEVLKKVAYNNAFDILRRNRWGSSADYAEVAKAFEALGDYQDSKEQAAKYRSIEQRERELEAERARQAEEKRIEQERLEQERRLENERLLEQQRIEDEARRKKQKKIMLIASVVTAVAIVCTLLYVNVLKPRIDYSEAERLLAEGKYEEASEMFVSLGEYSDAAQRVKEPFYVYAEVLLSEGQYAEASRMFVKAGEYSDAAQRIREPYYVHAEVLLSEGKYAEARVEFIKANDYADAAQRILEMDYAYAEALLSEGKYAEALLCYRKCGDYQDAKSKADDLIVHVADRISAGDYHTVGLKSDGTVVAVGDNDNGQCNTNGWKDIVAIAASTYHTVGLKSNGTVMAVGNNGDGQCDVSGWTDIVAIAAGDYHTVGLKSDGRVVAVGYNKNGQCDVSGWTDIVAIAAGIHHTVGLKLDGTVMAVGYNGDGQCDVSGWTDIVAIAAGDYHTVGLKSDGRVVAVGYNKNGQCDVSGWNDIVAIAAGDYHTVGLKADSSVVAVGKNDDGQCDVSGWTDIVAIAAGDYHTVGLKSNGRLLAAGSNKHGQCDVRVWYLRD